MGTGTQDVYTPTEQATVSNGRPDVSLVLANDVRNSLLADPAIMMRMRTESTSDLGLPVLDIRRDSPNEESARNAMSVLTRPYKPGAWMPGSPTNVFDAIDGHYLNGNHDGQIGRADIDRYLMTSGVPFADRTVGLSDQDKAALQWLSNNWDSPEVKALRHGNQYLSAADLASYNRTPAGQPVPNPDTAKPNDPARANEPGRPGTSQQQNDGVRRQLREGTYSVDENDPNRNAQSDHTDLFEKGKTKIWADRGQGGRDIGYTWQDPKTGAYVGFKFNPNEEGGRWELYNGDKFLGKAKDVHLTDKGLSVDGNILPI